MIETIVVTVALSFVGATHSHACGNCLVTVCEYRMDPKINYYKSWYPTVKHVPYGSQCPASVKQKIYVTRSKKR